MLRTSICVRLIIILLSRLAKHALDTGNAGIQAAVHCERTINLLDHIRTNHKDVSALIRLQKQLSVRRKMLFRVKAQDYLAYHQILRTYDIEDLESPKGNGVHRQYFYCTRRAARS